MGRTGRALLAASCAIEAVHGRRRMRWLRDLALQPSPIPQASPEPYGEGRDPEGKPYCVGDLLTWEAGNGAL